MTLDEREMLLEMPAVQELLLEECEKRVSLVLLVHDLRRAQIAAELGYWDVTRQREAQRLALEVDHAIAEILHGQQAIEGSVQ